MIPAGGPDPRAVALPEDVLVACLKAVDPLNGLIDWQPSVSYDGMTRDHIRDIARILGPHLAAASESRAAEAEARAEAAERRADAARADALSEAARIADDHWDGSTVPQARGASVVAKAIRALRREPRT